VKKDKKKYWAEQIGRDWREVKATKKGFMPKHTKIRDGNSVVVPSNQRPEILADYFEKKQWGETLGPKRREEHANRKKFRNNILFEERANVKTGDYELHEMKKVLNKMKTKRHLGRMVSESNCLST
jgi:hypothetical protein